MNFNPKTLSDWMMDKEEVELSLSESNEERFTQQTLYLNEPEMDEIQIKVRNKLPISQMEQVKHLFYVNRAVCHKEFMENYIPRFGALIWTLRHEENWVIEKERCNDDTHNHKSSQYLYVFKGVRK
jgi:hypothetical protein|tara:strand:- start:1466 stop:1843 length:378 start_codon:yes stop_codon:yes gene_type:complete